MLYVAQVLVLFARPQCLSLLEKASWPLPVLLDKKGMILESLAFLGPPCQGWTAEALLCAEGSYRQQKKTPKTYRESEKGFGLEYMSQLCSSQEGSESQFVSCHSCYFTPKSSSLIGASC